MEDFQIVAESLVTTGAGVNVTGTGTLKIGASASISLASGATLSLASGVNTALASGANVSVASGASVSLASGASLTVASGANLIAPSVMIGAPGTASVSIATASGTSIPVAQGIVRGSCTAATTSGSCTLAAGAVDGQQVLIVNESANNIVISGNMKGAAATTIGANAGQAFVWVSTDTAWFPV